MDIIAHKNNRIDVLDAVRGVAIIAMVVYHACYDISDVFGYKIWIFDFFTILEPWFAGAFILLCGVSCIFSHSNLKRGVRVFAIAMAVTLATVLFSVFISPGQEIYFGILHFMGAAILLYVLIHKFTDRIRPAVALPIYLLFFAVMYIMPFTYQIGFPGLFTVALPQSLSYFSETLIHNIDVFFGVSSPSWLAGVIGLYPLGLPGVDFSSADYFPLIPWFFLFLAGTVIGVPIKEHKLPEKFYTVLQPFLYQW